MLLHYGFDELESSLKCPTELKRIILNCIKTHKRSLPALINQGLHPFSALSNAISWEANCDINRYLHESSGDMRIDFKLQAFGLQLSQGLYRQEAAGKTGLACLMIGEVPNHMVINLSGGKADPEGKSNYGKRFACNFLEPHNCLPTAIGRIIFSRDSTDSSQFLYMSDIQAQHYQEKFAAKSQRNKSLQEPIRIRNLGPHTKFRVQFKRAVSQMELARPRRFGIDPKLIAPHHRKRTAYRQIRRMRAIQQEHVCARADHRSGLAFHYGSKAVAGNLTSGGPPERIDFSMAKTLANLPNGTLDFNRCPPHFSAAFIESIDFNSIVPCFKHLKPNVVSLLPLLLAQLVHHYNSPAGIATLSQDNPLLMSPLWSDEGGILYRKMLHSHLLGAMHGPSEIIAPELRDMEADDSVCQKQILKNSAASLEVGISIARKLNIETTGTLNEQCLRDTKIVYREVTGSDMCAEAAGSAAAESVLANTGHTVASPAGTGTVVSPTRETMALPYEDFAHAADQVARPTMMSFRVLEQSPPPFEIPLTMACKFCWTRMHWKGGDRMGLWRDKKASDISSLVTGVERQRSRELFNKALVVSQMLLGTNSFADVDRVGVSTAWKLVSQKVTRIWGFDLLGSGETAIRSIHNIMRGKDTQISKEDCNQHWKDCIESSWTADDCESNGDDAVIEIDEQHEDQNNDVPITSETDTANALAMSSMASPSLSAAPVEGIECFVCEKCTLLRLFPDWSKYMEHARQHLAISVQKSWKFIKDEVRVVQGIKGSGKTSGYVKNGSLVYKRYNEHEKLGFLKQRIMYRNHLRQNDHVVFVGDSSLKQTACVIDPQIQPIQRVMCVKVALLADIGKVIMCPVSQIISVTSSAIQSITSPSKAESSLLSIWGPLTMTPSSPHKVFPKIQSTQRPKVNAETHSSPKTLTKRLLFKPSSSSETDTSVMQIPQATKAVICDSHSSPQTRAPAVPQSPRLTRNLRSVELHTEFMLRATESNCLCCHKHWLRAPAYPGLYKEWRISNQTFLDIDYGMRFGLIYPRHVHLILEMYPVLDESNRCFFMTLGIATDLDPFHLQCAFRRHVKKLQSKPMSLKSTNLRNLAIVLEEGLDENQPVDSALLSFCWPPALERFQITIISCRPITKKGSPYTLTIFDPTPDVKKQSIVLKVENGHYTLLRQLVSSTVELSKLFSPDSVNRPPFLHIECPTLQMPDIDKYQVFSSSNAYLASALPGSIPRLQDRIRIWKTLKHLIPDDFRKKENSGSTNKKTQHEHTGSLQWDSWDLIRRALVSGLGASVGTDKPGSASYTRSTVPRFCGASNTTADSHSNCCFLDIGSEIGRGLYAMLGDPNIIHIAGIEIQQEMFAVSVSIFEGVRRICLQEGLRMPQVTLLNSCMLKRCPELDVLYSFADIIWINNFVFDRDIYFSETKDATSDRHVSKQFDKNSRFLSPNLAARLRTALRDSTCLAVFVPQSFHVDFAVQSKVSVGVTWGQPSSVHTAHILKNYHRIQIHNELHLICANHSEASRYEKLLKAYCEGLSTVLATALHSEPAALAERMIDGHLVIDDDTETRTEHEQDWPQDIPRIASRGPKTFIGLEELVCIQHTAWFNSALIGEFKYALQKSFPDVYILNEYCHVGYLQELMLQGTTKKNKSILKSITGASVVLFIFNLDGVHWIAARICKRTASVCVMDSFQNPNDDVIQSLQELAKQYWKIDLRPYSAKVPHQENSYDCGPLACLFALFLAQTAVDTIRNPVALTYNSKSTAREMRIRILADLYAGCITKLQPSAQ